MNIRIYQVNMERDSNNIAFMPYESLQRLQGSFEVDSNIYDKVFEGDVDCKNLESVYTMFNVNPPNGYKARSLSVSDVVEIIDDETKKSSFRFCDSFGFKEINFSPDDCQIGKYFMENKSKEKLSILLVQPGKYPKMIEIEASLESMQKVVGGDIEEYMPFEDDVAIICNEEGKVNGLPLNRAVYSDSREMMDIIAGDFFIVHAPIEADSFRSLPKELAEKYSEKFKYPERFAKVNSEIIAVPFKPVRADMER